MSEPRTEAGQTLAGRDDWHRRMAIAIEEQAATEARRELLAKVHDLLRGTEDPANWGVPEDYASGWIGAVYAVEELLRA